jgi:hypothetical protein
MKAHDMKKIVISACALAVLGACGQRGATDTAAKDAAPGAAATVVAGTDPAASAKRMASYTQALAPLVAGAYGGNCSSMAGAAPKEGVQINAAGQVSAAGFSHDLASIDETLVVVRTMRAGVADGAMLMARSNAPKWTVSINSGAQSSATFGEGEAVTSCQQVAPLGLMKVKSIYPTLAPIFGAGAATLSCVVDLTDTRELAVSAGPDGVTVDGKLISIARNMSKESATVDAGAKLLSYVAAFEDGTQLSIGVDDSGKIAEMSSSSQGKAAFMCAKAQA